VNGQTVNLRGPRGYDSPFLRSDWNSGLIYIRKGNDTEILDFRNPDHPVKTAGAPLTPAFPPGVGSDRPVVFGQN
jgi:1,6-anhydro-N-acetylmuramate kinase